MVAKRLEKKAHRLEPSRFHAARLRAQRYCVQPLVMQNCLCSSSAWHEEESCQINFQLSRWQRAALAPRSLRSGCFRLKVLTAKVQIALQAHLSIAKTLWHRHMACWSEPRRCSTNTRHDRETDEQTVQIWGGHQKKKRVAAPVCNPPFETMVGVKGFEPSTPCTPCKCATRLRHTPTSLRL